MPAHLLSESDWILLQEIVTWFRQNRGSLNKLTRQPALPNEIQDILTPEVYIARTPTAGIPALVQSSSAGTGTPQPIQDPDRPGYAFCYIYTISDDDFGVERLYPIGQAPLKVYNLLNVAIPGNAWLTPIRMKQGKWLVPAQGFNFAQCTDEEPGTGTGTGTGTGSNGEDPDTDTCNSGLCGDEGVAPSLSMTTNSRVGCFVNVPDNNTLSCSNATIDSHNYTIGGLSAPCTPSIFGMIFTPGDTFHTLSINNVVHISESGSTCHPISAVFLVDGFNSHGDGSSITITIVE